MDDKSFFKKAVPIWIEDNCSEKNQRVIFQTEIVIQKDTMIHLATSCVYNLFVDGTFVAYGPARAGRDVFRVDVIDLSEYARQRKHRLTIEVQFYNVNSFYIMKQDAFLQAEVITGGIVESYTGDALFQVAIDDTLVQRVQRFSFQRPFVEAYRLNEHSYDYRVNGLYESREFKVLHQRKMIERGAPYPIYENMKARLLYQGKAISHNNPEYVDTRSYTNINEKLEGFLPEQLEWHISREVQSYSYEQVKGDVKETLSSEQYSIYELEYNAAGFLTLEMSAKKHSVLYLIFDEVLLNDDVCMTRDECCRAIKYELEPGSYHLKLFEVYGMKYVKVFVQEGECDIKRVELITYMHPQIDWYQEGVDADTQCLINAAIHTYRANAVDLFTDCPTRERGGYLCDSFFMGRVEHLFTGKNLVEKSFLQNFLHEDTYQCIDEGIVPMCYPADHYDGVYIPNWGLWLILELEEFYMRTGDRDFIDAYRTKVEGILEFHRKLENEEFLLTHVPEGVFVEWSHANEMVQDINFPSNMLYCEALRTASRLYGNLAYEEKANKVKEAVIKYSFNGKFFCDHAKVENGMIRTVDESSEVCQYYAFCFGIADKKSFSDLYNRLLTEFTEKRHTDNAYPEICFAVPFIGVPLRIEMLLKYGEWEQAYREIMYYYLPQAKLTGTLWECFDMASCNHGFSSIVAYWLDKISREKEKSK